MKYVTVCIPTYEMHGLGAQYLAESFERLARQTFTDFDVVVSDHSQNDAIKETCAAYADRLVITYIRNKDSRGNSSANINNAIRNATGRLIKILFQDDFLYGDDALSETVRAFDIERDHWLASACLHTQNGTDFHRPFIPRYNRYIHLGNNTISSPSVLTIKNESPLLFDESLIWLMDCDYYRRCYDAFGKPKILHTITVANRTGAHQVSNTRANARIRQQELRYMFGKYPKRLGEWFMFLAQASRNIVRIIF